MAKSIKISSELKIQLEEVLHGISHLDTPDLEKFLAEVAHLLVKRKVKTLPKREAELLLKSISLFLIKKNSKAIIPYMKSLSRKASVHRTSNITEFDSEREEKGVERLRSLVELSQIRKVSLQELMQELGIHTLADAA